MLLGVIGKDITIGKGSFFYELLSTIFSKFKTVFIMLQTWWGQIKKFSSGKYSGVFQTSRCHLCILQIWTVF